MANLNKTTEFSEVFDAMCGVLRRQARRGSGLEVLYYSPGSKAKEKKPTLTLLGKKEVRIHDKPPQKMFVAGVILQKDYVSFHFLPIYGQPKAFALSPSLKKMLKGKACFHIQSADKATLGEVGALLAQGVACFRKLGWV